eukprot:Opistho-2@70269
MPVGSKGTTSLSSLPLQAILYFDKTYFTLYWFIEALCFIYKGNVLPYPTHNLGAEVFLLFLFFPVQSTRIFLCMKGNLTERKVPILASILLAIPVLFTFLFFLLWQTYVLRLEQIVNYIGLAFLGIEFIFCITTVITFVRLSPYK